MYLTIYRLYKVKRWALSYNSLIRIVKTTHMKTILNPLFVFFILIFTYPLSAYYYFLHDKILSDGLAHFLFRGLAVFCLAQTA